MKAVVYDKSNSPDTLVLRELAEPIPNDNEVLVKIYTVSVNAADYRSMKMGAYSETQNLWCGYSWAG